MSLLNKYQRRSVAPLQQTGFGTLTNWSGEQVSEDTALQIAAVMACVGLIADSVASLPIRTVQQVGDRLEPVPTPALFTDPAPTVTSYELVHQSITSLALYGNAYLYLDMQGSTPIGLTPLHPNNVDVVSLDSYDRQYTVAGTPVESDRIRHIRWWTPPQAVKGLSPIQEQKTTIGLALAMERHLSQFYAEGGTPSSVLETDADLTVEQAKKLQKTWLDSHNRHRKPAVLANGLKWKPVTASAADMELNATRELQIAQIARTFRVPTYMIGAKGDSQTYQNAEMAGMHFVTYTLMPWIRRLEDAFTSLLPKPRIVRFDTDAFLRADVKTRYQVHQIGISSGIISPNEARLIENYEPYQGGDEFVMALPGAPMAGPQVGSPLPPVGEDERPHA